MQKNRAKTGRKQSAVVSRSVKASLIRPRTKYLKTKRRIISPKKLASIPAKGRRPLLIHHSHTGKRLSVHHSSFAVLGLMVLLVGILLASISFNANAQDLAVSAKVSAPLPSGPATITSPSDQDTFTTFPIVLNGTCPAGEIVKLYRNSAFSGSVGCSAGGSFAMQTDLSDGANVLQARIFNYTDDEGPASPSITVFYNPPAPTPTPTPTPTPGTGSTPTPTPQSHPPANTPSGMSLQTDSTTIKSQIGKQIELLLQTSGGVAPYNSQVDWGDGGSNTYNGITGKTYTISHIYDDLGSKFGEFSVKIRLTDASGKHAFLQIAVTITGPTDARVPHITLVNDSQGSLKGPLNIAWFGFAGLTIALSSFWLGSHWVVHGLGLKPKLKH